MPSTSDHTKVEDDPRPATRRVEGRGAVAGGGGGGIGCGRWRVGGNGRTVTAERIRTRLRAGCHFHRGILFEAFFRTTTTERAMHPPDLGPVPMTKRKNV